MRYLILLLLLPSLLLGADEKFVITTEKNTIVQPVGTADRVGERTSTSVSYQDTASFNAGDYKGGTRQVHIFTERVHWRKSASDPWERYNLTKTATASALVAKTDSKVVVEFDEQIDAGPFKAEYRTGNPGRNKYTHWRGTSLGFFPADNVADLKTTLTVSSTGMKEVVELTSESPTRLAWGYRLTGHDPKMPLAENAPIYGVDGMINGFFPAITATDQLGLSVSNEVEITNDSIIVTYGTIAVGDTVFHDPAVQDTVPYASGTSSRMDVTAGTYPFSRDTLYAEHKYTWSTSFTSSGATGDQTYRAFVGFPLAGLDTDQLLDSAYVVASVNTDPTDSVCIYFVPGTWTGVVAEVGDWHAFIGNKASGEYTRIYALDDSTSFTDAPIKWHNGDGADAVSNARIKTAWVDSITTLWGGSDTLRFAILALDDIKSDNGGNGFWATGNVQPYLVFFTHGAFLPGMITVADSDSIPTVNVSVVVTIDSTGGGDLSSVGVRYFALDAHADTSAVDSAGTFDEADSVSIILPLLLPDTSYVWWAVGENAAGESVGIPDTLSTTVAGAGTGAGAALTVQGRTVNWSN